MDQTSIDDFDFLFPQSTEELKNKKIEIYCNYQGRKYRFTAPALITHTELERRIRRKMNISDNFIFKKTSFQDILCDKDEFEFINLPKQFMPNGKIVFISEYFNCAWGYTHKGLFIDTLGNVYSFNFDELYGNLRCENRNDLIRRLKDLRYRIEPVVKIDARIVKEFIDCAKEIDDKESCHSEHFGFDMGENSLVFCNPETSEIIILCQSGDYNASLTDDKARMAIKIGTEIKKTVNHLINGKTEESLLLDLF